MFAIRSSLSPTRQILSSLSTLLPDAASSSLPNSGLIHLRSLSLFFRNSLFFFFRLLFSVFIFKTTTHTKTRSSVSVLCFGVVQFSSARRYKSLVGWLAGWQRQSKLSAVLSAEWEEKEGEWWWWWWAEALVSQSPSPSQKLYNFLPKFCWLANSVAFSSVVHRHSNSFNSTTAAAAATNHTEHLTRIDAFSCDSIYFILFPVCV